MRPLIQYREIRRRYELEGAQATCEHFAEALEEKHLAPEDFSIRDLAEGLVVARGTNDVIGHEWVRSLDPRREGSIVQEASDGVDVTAFSNITGQLLINKLLEAYNSPEFVFSRLVDTQPTSLDGEKIPGVEPLKPKAGGDSAYEVHPGMPIPHMGFGEDYIETPKTAKHAFIVPVTKEAIFFDRTGLVLRRASDVGELLGLDKEERIVRVCAGINNNFKWKGTSYNTYQTSTPWINTKSGVELLDWTDLDEADQLFADMLDPVTGKPILVGGKQMVVTPAKAKTARRILNAIEVRHGDGASNSVQTLSGNPIQGVEASESALFYRNVIDSGVSAANAKNWWLYGNFRKAFAYMENWPITVVQAPANSEAEFNQDIVLRFKASERGVIAVIDPRQILKLYQA